MQRDAAPMRHCFGGSCGSATVAAALVQGGRRHSPRWVGRMSSQQDVGAAEQMGWVWSLALTKDAAIRAAGPHRFPLEPLQEVSLGAKLPLGLHASHAKCNELPCLLRGRESGVALKVVVLGTGE